MTTFFIIALVIAMAGSAMVLGPVLRTYFRWHEDDPQPGITVGTGVIVALLIPVAALVLYSRWTNWNWSSGGVAATAQTEEMHSMEEAVAGLEKRLRDQPDDVQGWLMLGRSRMVLEEPALAKAAFERARELAAENPDRHRGHLGWPRTPEPGRENRNANHLLCFNHPFVDYGVWL